MRSQEAGIDLGAKRLREIFDQLSEGVCIFGTEGHLRDANKAALQILGHGSVEEFRHQIQNEPERYAARDHNDEPLALHQWLFASAQRGETVRPRWLQFTKATGDRGWLLINVSPIFDPSAKTPAGAVVSFIDITQQRLLERQLNQNQRLESVSTLASGVAHDFNNLLTVIMGNLNMIASQDTLNDVGKDHLRLALDAAGRAAELTRSLLSFGRSANSRQVAGNLNEIVKDAVRLLRKVIPERIKIVTRLEENLWSSKFDTIQMETILANLCTNCRDAIPGKGTITIRTANRVISARDCRDSAEARPGEFTELAIIDDGEGMSKRTAERMFEPFFTTKGVGRGTGLGLPAVHGIVKAHGGWLTVRTAPAKGTTVSVFLPASSESLT